MTVEEALLRLAGEDHLWKRYRYRDRTLQTPGDRSLGASPVGRDGGKERHVDEREMDHAGYVSFVLRCWKGEEFQVRARLIEVPSGISHPVADLGDLGGLVQQLVAHGEMPPHETPGAARRYPPLKEAQK